MVNRPSFRRLPLFAMLAVVTGSSLLSVLMPPSSVSADPNLIPTTASKFTPDQEIQSLSYYSALIGCVDKNMYSKIQTKGTDNANAVPSTWFNDYEAWGYIYPSGKMDCKDIAVKALSLWGYQNNALFLATSGYTYDSKTAAWSQPSGGDSARLPAFELGVNSNVYGRFGSSYRPSLSDAARYVMALTYFQSSACSAKDLGVYSTMSNPTLKGWVDSNGTFKADDPAAGVKGIDKGSVTYSKITTVTADKKTEVHGYVYQSSDRVVVSGGKGGSAVIGGATSATLYGYHVGPTTRTCDDFAKDLTNYAPKYVAWLIDPDNVGAEVTTPEGEKTCTTDGTCPAESDESSCKIPQLGWILCPILTTGAGLADGLYKYMADSFLATDPSLVNTDPDAVDDNGQKIGTGTYQAWQMMRSFANVAFIIVFLVIIVSQLTSVGIGNFGIKKLLPRLVIAAILVNLSFLVCQLAVDLSNILGYSLKDMMTAIAGQITAEGSQDVSGNDGNLAGALTTIAIAGTFAWLNIGAIIIGIVGAVVTLLTIFVLLIVRKALIIMLVVIAPLAFVAYLLPNTEPLFHKWRKGFTALLMLFPVIGLLYGAGALASAIILQVAPPPPKGTVMIITAYIVLVVPLIAAIPLLKGSLSAFGAIGGAINSLGNRASKAAGGVAGKRFDESRLGQFRKYRGQERSRHSALSRSGIDRFRGGGKNPANWGKATNRGLNKISGKFGRNLSATGAELASGMETEQTKAAETLLRSQVTGGTTEAKTALDKALRSGDAVQVRAASNVMFSQGSSGFHDVYDSVNQAQQDGYAHRNSVAALRSNITENHGQLVKTKAVDLSKWAGVGGSLAGHTASKDTWSNMSQADLAGQTSHSLQRGANVADGRGIDAATAAALLVNDQLNGNLNDGQIYALRQAARQGGPGSGGGRPAPAPDEPAPFDGYKSVFEENNPYSEYYVPTSGGGGTGSTPGGGGGPVPGGGGSPAPVPAPGGGGQGGGTTPSPAETAFEDGEEFTVPRVTEADLDRFETEELNRRRAESNATNQPERQTPPDTGSDTPTQ